MKIESARTLGSALLCAWLGWLVATTACSSPPPATPPPEEPDPADGGIAAPAATELPFRLIDHLAEAQIDSPLARVAAVQQWDLDESLKSSTIRDFAFDAQTKNPRFPGTGCRIDLGPGGGKTTLVYRGRDPHHCVLLIPAQPSTHYRIRRSVHTEDANIDFQVIESRAALRFPQETNHPTDLANVMNGRFVSMRQLLMVHHFDRPRAGQWDTGVSHVFTSPYTRSLVVLLNDAEGLVRGRTRRTYFDDIRVDKLAPSPEQELALLKAADSLSGHDGLAKHGQLLPVGLLTQAIPPYDHNYDYREAILAPSPTTLRFELSNLPDDARLDFSYAMHKATRRGDSVTFRVEAIVSGGERQPLFEKTITVQDEGPGWRWFDARVPLETLSGSTATLILETESSGKRGYGLWGAPIVEQPATKERPNVILIAVDTLRADRLSAYGYDRNTSPHIDRLAADSAVFERAMSASNWTSPSFASIFTGRTASRHQVVHRARSIPKALRTLPEYFRDAGYVTEAIMYKAYLYNMGFEQGFDRWFNVPHHDIDARANLREAMHWLERNHDRRFFLFLHFNDPHQPFNQPKPFDTQFSTEEDLRHFAIQLPTTITGDNYVKGCGRCTIEGKLAPRFRSVGRDLYDGEIAFIDDRLGVFLNALRTKGIYDNTIIVFVADHGEMMWEHADTFGHGGPWLYDTLTRVPLIVKDIAGRGQPGRVAHAVQSYDLMPTLIELAGLEIEDQELNARSLRPWVKLPSTPAAERPCVSENVKQHVTSVVQGDWKLIVNHPPERRVTTRLFNLNEDPNEQRDIKTRHPARAATLGRAMADWIVQNRRGLFLAYAPGPGAGSMDLTVRSGSPMRRARAWFGASGVSQDSKLLQTVTGEHARLVFIEIDRTEDATLTVAAARKGESESWIETTVEPDAIAQYESEDIERLFASEEPTVRVFRGAPPVLKEETKQMNAQRLEALRALGYIQ